MLLSLGVCMFAVSANAMLRLPSGLSFTQLWKQPNTDPNVPGNAVEWIPMKTFRKHVGQENLDDIQNKWGVSTTVTPEDHSEERLGAAAITGPSKREDYPIQSVSKEKTDITVMAKRDNGNDDK